MSAAAQRRPTRAGMSAHPLGEQGEQRTRCQRLPAPKEWEPSAAAAEIALRKTPTSVKGCDTRQHKGLEVIDRCLALGAVGGAVALVTAAQLPAALDDAADLQALCAGAANKTIM